MWGELDSRLRGERGADARRFVALSALVVALGAWALIFAGAVDDHDHLLSSFLQIAASGTAAVLLGVVARRPEPPLGPATGALAMGAAVWCATDIAWWAVTEFDLAGPAWLNLGYATGTVLYAAAVWSATRPPTAGSAAPVTRGLGVIDGILIAGGIVLWWLYTVWEPLVGGTQTTITLMLTVVDAAFLAGALLAWSRSSPSSRSAMAWVLVAAMVLTTTDVLYARAFADYSIGDLLDFGWFAASVLLAVSSFHRRGATASAGDGWSGFSRWAQAMLAPVLVIVIVAVIAVQHQRPAEHGHLYLDGAIWVLVFVLVVRQVVQIVEHRALTRRLRETAEIMRHQAEHDDLTGLLDRQAFHERVDVVLGDRRADGGTMTFLWVHLDSLGQIDDLLGTKVGDQVLRLVADRLRSLCAPADVLARCEDADFVALRPQADGSEDRWAEQARAALADVFEVDGVRIRLTCAIGILESRAEHDDSGTLLSDAAIAVADVKRQGRNRVTRHRLEPHRIGHDRRVLAQDLRTAIDEQQLRVHYQPICDLHTGHVLGCEALVRFEHPARGDIEPADFLPVAEATGLMSELAMFVLNEACATFAEDPTLGWVTVNLSESDLADPRLVDRLAATLDRTGLEPDRLLIELSERVVPAPDVIRGIERLRELGIGLALDDFGSAWTSLAQVRELAVRIVKLDRSVIEQLDAAGGAEFRALLRTVVALADVLDVVVLAEGIETERQLEECRAAGVRLGQGFLWAPALPVTAMVRYVASAGSALLDPDHRNPLRR